MSILAAVVVALISAAASYGVAEKQASDARSEGRRQRARQQAMADEARQRDVRQEAEERRRAQLEQPAEILPGGDTEGTGPADLLQGSVTRSAASGLFIPAVQ